MVCVFCFQLPDDVCVCVCLCKMSYETCTGEGIRKEMGRREEIIRDKKESYKANILGEGHIYTPTPSTSLMYHASHYTG